jgi:GT2 family glycosyltransferase/predicted O-methyltransferase YrrM
MGSSVMPRHVSVIVPAHGNIAMTAHCLDCLQKTVGRKRNTEVIVVDDGSPDETPGVVADEYPWVSLVRHEEPRGFAPACNAGAAAASADYLLFFNNDLYGEPGWLNALLAYSDANPGVAAIGSKLVYPNRTIQHAGIVICGDLLPRHVYRLFPEDHLAVSRSRRFQAVTAACVLIARVPFDEVGGFDEGFSNGFEDVDLCLRLGAAGYDVAYCAESTLVHFEGATRGEDADLFRRNAERYLDRWGETLRPDDLITYVQDGLVQLEPSDIYPLRLAVSPELAVVETRELDALKLLGIRSRQVFDLLKENTRLLSAMPALQRRPQSAEQIPPRSPAVFESSSWQMSFGERAALEGLLSEVKPQIAIELGTAQGGSLRRIAAHSGTVHTFDLVDPPVDRSEFTNVEFHVGDSHALLSETLAVLASAGLNVDFVLVDGDHSSKGVRRDLEDLLESPAVGRTLIVMHDTANEVVREGLGEVPFEAYPKVAYVELDFVGGYVFREPALHNQLWGGLGVAIVDVDRNTTSSGPVRSVRYYESGVLLRHARDGIVERERLHEAANLLDS